jgi:cysteine desulfurase family protein (TIGR01976 family)
MTSVVQGGAAAVAPVEEIRGNFPALERTHGGHPVAYFDGPGGTQVPRVVVDMMADYMFHHNANTHWAYPSSVETDEALAAARVALADFLGGSASEVSFGANMTTITFHLARALARQWDTRDEIVVTELDHHANLAPWQAIAKERGFMLRMARLRPEDGRLDLDHLGSLIGPRTRLVAVGAASNALGTITDVGRACAMAREGGALSFVDAVHYAPHQLVDVRAIGCDFLACSAYKFYGPHIGVLWGREALLAALDVPKLEPAPQEAPERMETGTQNHEGIVGAAAAVNFLASLSPSGADRRGQLTGTFAALHARGEEMLRVMWEGLSALPKVTMYGPRPGTPRTPTVAFTVEGLTTTQVAERLAERGVFVSNGDFYATTVAKRYERGEDGFVRAGCSCYTTMHEVERLVEGVAALPSS